MKLVFADSGYFVALLNPRDPLHARAIAVSTRVEEADLVTSELVLTELLNHFGDSGSALRNAASSFVRRLYSNPKCRIVPLGPQQFHNALFLYEKVRDKGWTLTDCSSILIMQKEKIDEALTHDRHFLQAGFTALLRED